VQRCQDIPGHELFQYLDENGDHHGIGSADVNEYLKEISGEEFTAKDFRTWSGTVMASMTLRELEPFTSETQAKKNIVQAIKGVAQRLGNTPSVCRKCYVHPELLEHYLAGAIQPLRVLRREVKAFDRILQAEEAALMKLLRKRLK
jgi:DNA topoisomerase-1